VASRYTLAWQSRYACPSHAESGENVDAERIAVIVEDDRDIRDLIQAVLTQSGFKVFAAASGAEGVAAVREHDPVIVTLDLGLPDIDGFEAARQIRLFSDTYIIMLTAKAEELDTLLGLESGADDYITKPFRPRELRARIAAMLRRPRTGATPTVATAAGQAEDQSADSHAPISSNSASRNGTGPSPAAQTGVPASGGGLDTQASEESASYVHNGLTLNHKTRTAMVEGAEVELTRTEFDLLHALLESGRVVRTKTDLVRRLRYEEYDTGSFISDADERAIEVHVGNLRRKLGDNSRSPKWLETVRGVGYRLTQKQ
jgi:two-component system, OmpR family, response regulator